MWYDEGDALGDLHRYSEALAAFEKAVAIAGRLPAHDSDSLLGTNLEAKRAPIKLAMLLANCPDASYRDPRRALKIAQGPEELKADGGMLLTIGLAHYHSGDLQAAIETCKQMSPARPETLVGAMAYERLGEHEKARFHYDTAVARYQNVLVLQAGGYLGEWHSHRDPRRLFQQASEVLGIDTSERDAIAAHWLGIALRDKGQPAAAIESFRKAIELKPNYAEAYCGLGDALARMGQFEASIVAFGEGIELHPSYAQLYNDLAWLLATCSDLQFRNPARAIEMAEKATELNPTLAIVWNTLGVSHYRNGNYQAAADALQKSLELSQNGTGFTTRFDGFFLAMALWQLGDHERARECYRTADTWMQQRKPDDEELKRFREEATELLGKDAIDETTPGKL